jgi:PiT family inorganic phosphate transporter
MTAAATIAAADGFGFLVPTSHVFSSAIAATVTANGPGS